MDFGRKITFISPLCAVKLTGRKRRCLTCPCEAMVSLLVLLDSLYRAVFLGDRGLGATLGGENTSSSSSIVSTLAPPPSPFLPLSPLTAHTTPSSSNSFWRLIASTCLILLFSSRTRSISMKSSCTCSSLEEKAHIHVCVSVWPSCDAWWIGFILFLGTERICQHSRSGFCMKASVAPLCLWRQLLLQGPTGWCFHTQFLYMVSFFLFIFFPCIWKPTNDTVPQGKGVKICPSLLLNAKPKTGLFLHLKCLNKHAWARKQNFGFGPTKTLLTPQ